LKRFEITLDSKFAHGGIFCVLKVLILRFNCAAISVIVMPETNRRTTSSSRFDNRTSRCCPLADKHMLSSAMRTDGPMYSCPRMTCTIDMAQVVGFVDDGRHAHFPQAFEQGGILEHGERDDAHVRKLPPDITEQRHAVAILSTWHREI
jgi:hypothetical protein